MASDKFTKRNNLYLKLFFSFTLLSLFSLMLPMRLYATGDITPPQLVSLSVTPSSVNVSSHQQVINFNAQFTDDISGLSFVSVVLNSPSGQVVQPSGGLGITSGNSLSGIYNFTVTIPRYAEQGTWSIGNLQLRDNVGNSLNLNASQLAVRGLPSTIQVIDTSGDITPPQLVSLSVTPSSVNVSSQQQVINFNAQFTDDISGLSFVSVVLNSPSGQVVQPSGGLGITSGNSLSGIYNFTVTIPKNAEQGTWSIGNLQLRDNIGNSLNLNASQLAVRGLPSTIQVINSGSDTTAPQLISLSFTPTTVNVSTQAQTINFNAQYTDDISGLSFVSVVLNSPSGQVAQSSGGLGITSGNSLSGIYNFTVTIPQNAEQETWVIGNLQLRDIVGNTLNLNSIQLTALGIPSTIQVISSSSNNGVCGSSNSGTFTSAPTTNLCSTGAASVVTGTGPWNWTCAGSNGGSTASCSANKSLWTLSGTIYGGSSPLPNMAVTLTDASTLSQVGSTTTNATGVYSFSIGNGNYILNITPLQSSGYDSSTINGVVVNGANVTQNITLIQTAHNLSGVVQTSGGVGIPKLVINIYDPSSRTTVGQTATDANGSYSVLVSNGTYDIFVTGGSNWTGACGPNGTQAVCSSPSVPEPTYMSARVVQGLSVSSNTTQNITIPFVTLSGKTTDNNGTPIGNVTIIQHQNNNVQVNGITYTVGDDGAITSDASGNYSLTFIPGNGYRITVTPPNGSGYAQTVVNGINILSDTVMNLAVQPALNISGVVQTSGGVGIPKLVINIYDPSSRTTVGQTATDANGSYSVLVSNGTYDIFVTGGSNWTGACGPNGTQAVCSSPSVPEPTYMSARVVQGLSVSSNTTQNITIPFVTLSGKTTDNNGTPIGNVTIIQHQNNNVQVNGITYTVGDDGAITSDASGNYSLTFIPGNGYRITVTPPNGSGYAQTVLNNLNIQQNTLQNIILQNAYFLSVVKNGTGLGTITSTIPDSTINCGTICQNTYISGTSVTILATPNSGSNFSVWNGCDSVSSTSCTVTMSAAKNVTATFDLLLADTTPPVTTASPIASTYNITQNITLSCNDGTGSGCAATYYCLGTGCTPTISYSAAIPISASQILRFYSKDIANNGESIQQANYIIDMNAPVTTASPIGGTYSSSQNVSLTCNDGGGSGCANTYYCLGSNCNPTTPYTDGYISIASSSDLRYFSKDNANNSEGVKSSSYNINPIIPPGPTPVAVMDGWWLLPGVLAGLGLFARRRKE